MVPWINKNLKDLIVFVAIVSGNCFAANPIVRVDDPKKILEIMRNFIVIEQAQLRASSLTSSTVDAYLIQKATATVWSYTCNFGAGAASASFNIQIPAAKMREADQLFLANTTATLPPFQTSQQITSIDAKIDIASFTATTADLGLKQLSELETNLATREQQIIRLLNLELTDAQKTSVALEGAELLAHKKLVDLYKGGLVYLRNVVEGGLTSEIPTAMVRVMQGKAIDSDAAVLALAKISLDSIKDTTPKYLETLWTTLREKWTGLSKPIEDFRKFWTDCVRLPLPS